MFEKYLMKPTIVQLVWQWIITLMIRTFFYGMGSWQKLVSHDYFLQYSHAITYKIILYSHHFNTH